MLITNLRKKLRHLSFISGKIKTMKDVCKAYELVKFEF